MLFLLKMCCNYAHFWKSTIIYLWWKYSMASVQCGEVQTDLIFFYEKVPIYSKLTVYKPVQLVLLMRRAGRPLLFITAPLFSSLSVKADLSAFQLTDSVLHKQNFLNMDYTNTAQQRRKCNASEAWISKHLVSDLQHDFSGNSHYCRDIPDGRRLC